MKQLILLRHAKAETPNYQTEDFLRNLTNRGITDCKLIAHKLQVAGLSPDKIIASSANRTTQTAKLFAESLQLATSGIDFRRSIYDGMSTQEFTTLIAKAEDKVDTILFVGHNPDIARFAYRLTDNFNYDVPTCTAILLEIATDSWAEIDNSPITFREIFMPKMYK